MGKGAPTGDGGRHPVNVGVVTSEPGETKYNR